MSKIYAINRQWIKRITLQYYEYFLKATLSRWLYLRQSACPESLPRPGTNNRNALQTPRLTSTTAILLFFRVNCLFSAELRPTATCDFSDLTNFHPFRSYNDGHLKTRISLRLRLTHLGRRRHRHHGKYSSIVINVVSNIML